MEGPQPARPADFDSLIELVDGCFLKEGELGSMAESWPHCYMPRAERLRHNLVIKEKDKVVAHVGYIPEPMVVEGTELKMAGISGVATHPEYRGRGLMSRLLSHSIELMDKEGYVLSDLGGDTQRYRRFGWENGGRHWTYHISPRSLLEMRGPEGWRIVDYEAKDAQVQTIMGLHEQEPARIKRTEEMYRLLLGRRGWRVWLAHGRAGKTAYVAARTVNPEKVAVGEVGGSPDGIHAILQFLVEKHNVKRVELSLPWWHGMNSRAIEISWAWSIQPFHMLRVNNLAGTVIGFASQLGNRYAALETQQECSVCLALDHTDQVVSLAFSRGKLSIETRDIREPILLDRLKMVRFLFGPASPSAIIDLPDDAKLLDRLLPLDFYVWRLETV